MRRDPAELVTLGAQRYLCRAGWRRTDDGSWVHPALRYPWPGNMALRLEREACEGDARARALLGRYHRWPSVVEPNRLRRLLAALGAW